MIGHLVLNALALASVVFGFANALLVFRVFGVGLTADIWISATTMMATLNIVSQLGVEQFPVFYSESRIEGTDEGRRFARDAMVWALASGAVLGVVCVVAAPLLVHAFAAGLPQAARDRTGHLLRLLAPIVAFSPALYVARQLLNVEQKYVAAALLGVSMPLIQFVFLLGAWLSGAADTAVLAGSVAATWTAVLAATLFALRPFFRTTAAFSAARLRAFVINSASMRAAHSVHNFFVVLLTNNFLSYAPAGSISLFQYAKRMSDGVAAVAISAQASIYHARQADAWARRSRDAFVANVRAYAVATLPLFGAVLLVTGLLVERLFQFASGVGPGEATALLKPAFLILAAWQAVIAVETIAVGVVVLAKNALLLLGCNALYLGIFWLLVSTGLTGAPLIDIAVGAAGAQLVSLSLFTALAVHIAGLRLQTTPALRV